MTTSNDPTDSKTKSIGSVVDKHYGGMTPKWLAEYHRKRLLPRLKSYKKPVCPVRTSDLPYKDDDLIDAVVEAKSHNGKRREARELLKSFGKWRSGVLRAESKGASNVFLLLSAFRAFEAAGDEDGAFQVRRFLANEYGFTPREGATVVEDRALAEVKARRHDVLSDEVLTEKKAPAWAPRDEDPPEQRGLYGELE